MCCRRSPVPRIRHSLCYRCLGRDEFKCCGRGVFCTKVKDTVERKLDSCEANLLVVKSFPRTRGVVPSFPPYRLNRCGFSPHTRGCSPVRPPSTAGPGSFPRTRGVVPQLADTRSRSSHFPRSRGVSSSKPQVIPQLLNPGLLLTRSPGFSLFGAGLF